jgi:hypothetical protein
MAVRRYIVIIAGYIGGFVGCDWRLGGQALVKDIAETFQGCDLSEMSPVTTSTELLNDSVFV